MNLLHLVPEETGGSELYVRRLIPALLSERDDLRLTLFAAREAIRALSREDWASGVEIVPVRVNARSRPRRVLAEQLLLRRAVRQARVDLLHNAFTTAPAFPGVPQVTTILDVIYKRFPDTHPGLYRHGMAVLVPLAARRSTRVLTLSESAKSDIVRLLGIPPERVDVTLLGPGLPAGVDPAPIVELRRRFDLADAPLLLTVSAKRPHKNLERLFEAFATLPGEPKLLVPGYETPFEDSLRARAEELGAADRIRFTGWVDERTLEGLYHAADGFVFPSLAEGFGLPVLEALLRGVPVACSRIGPLEEVAGDAALYFKPTDVGEIGRAMEKILSDAGLQERLRKAGPIRARPFTWKTTAAATLESYERALSSS